MDSVLEVSNYEFCKFCFTSQCRLNELGVLYVAVLIKVCVLIPKLLFFL